MIPVESRAATDPGPHRCQHVVDGFAARLGIASPGVVVRDGPESKRATIRRYLDRTPEYEIRVPCNIARGSTSVLRGVLAHEMQHARFVDILIPTTRQWLADIARIAAALAILVTGGLGSWWVAENVSATLGSLLLLGSAVAAIVALLRQRPGGRRDGRVQQQLELRADLEAARLAGLDDTLAWMHYRLDTRWHTRILESWSFRTYDHPRFVDRIAAVERFHGDPGDTLLAAGEFLLHHTGRPLDRRTRRLLTTCS